MSKLPLTAEERQVLQSLTKEQLIYLSKIADDKEFDVFIQIVNNFKDSEKDIFFKNPSYDKEKLAADLQFSRGTIAGQAKFVHIIGGARAELARRSQK